MNRSHITIKVTGPTRKTINRSRAGNRLDPRIRHNPRSPRRILLEKATHRIPVSPVAEQGTSMNRIRQTPSQSGIPPVSHLHIEGAPPHLRRSVILHRIRTCPAHSNLPGSGLIDWETNPTLEARQRSLRFWNIESAARISSARCRISSRRRSRQNPKLACSFSHPMLY
jgi:hypothetical protein